MMPSMPPDEERKDERRGTQLDRDRQPCGKQLAHREIRKIIAGAEVALQQIAKVEQVLLPERLIEMKRPLQIGLDDGIEPFS